MATKTITLTTDDDEEIELMVIEQTMINNVNYLLVIDFLSRQMTLRLRQKHF